LQLSDHGSEDRAVLQREPQSTELALKKAPKFRECITGEPGNLLVRADYRQIEIRVSAYRSKDTELTRQLAAGIDIHAANAARRLGCPVDKVPPDERKKAKAVTFGVLYQQSPAGMAATAFAQFGVHMTVDEAKAEISENQLTYPELHDYFEKHYRVCIRRGYVLTASGRVIAPMWEWEHLSPQDCANWPIQGDAADLMLTAVRLVYWAFRRANIRGKLIATVHDELLAEVAEADVSRAMEIMQAEMREAFVMHFPGAPTDKLIDINFGRTWAEAAKEQRA